MILVAQAKQVVRPRLKLHSQRLKSNALRPAARSRGWWRPRVRAMRYGT